MCLYRVFQISELGTIFWRSAPKFCSNWEFLLSRRVVKVRLLEQKQFNIDTNILHQVALEFDVDSKNRIKNYKCGLFAQIWDTLYTDYLGIKYMQISARFIFVFCLYKRKIKQVTRMLKIHLITL